MIDTKIIDGKAFAANLRADIARRVEKLKTEKNITPGLAVILVGNVKASELYVNNKRTQAEALGMKSVVESLSSDISQDELLSHIGALNRDPSIHGILVQLPLPEHIDKNAIIEAISPTKDVDGFHPENVHKLESGQEGFIPCTPLGCLMLLKDTVKNLRGKNAVVMGRSFIVGKPMAELLRQQGCAIEVIHSKTSNEDRARWLKAADIIVVAVGKPGILRGSNIKPGAVIIDVGINHIPSESGKPKLVGDVDFESSLGIAGAITPVPGGVGPMTIACLLENTYRAAMLTIEK